MCRGCGKVKYVQPEFGEDMSVESYRTTETVLIVYSGSGVLRVTGCKSGHLYLFGPDSVRSVDKYDAGCLVDVIEGFAYEPTIQDNSSESTGLGEDVEAVREGDGEVQHEGET